MSAAGARSVQPPRARGCAAPMATTRRSAGMAAAERAQRLRQRGGVAGDQQVAARGDRALEQRLRVAAAAGDQVAERALAQHRAADGGHHARRRGGREGGRDARAVGAAARRPPGCRARAAGRRCWPAARARRRRRSDRRGCRRGAPRPAPAIDQRGVGRGDEDLRDGGVGEQAPRSPRRCRRRRCSSAARRWPSRTRGPARRPRAGRAAGGRRRAAAALVVGAARSRRTGPRCRCRRRSSSVAAGGRRRSPSSKLSPPERALASGVGGRRGGGGGGGGIGTRPERGGRAASPRSSSSSLPPSPPTSPRRRRRRRSEAGRRSTGAARARRRRGRGNRQPARRARRGRDVAGPKRRRSAAAEVDADQEVAHVDPVRGRQEHRPADLPAVDVGAVRALEVGDLDLPWALHREPRVPLRDVPLGEHDVVAGDAADRDFVLVEGEQLRLTVLLCQRQLDHGASGWGSVRNRRPATLFSTIPRVKNRPAAGRRCRLSDRGGPPGAAPEKIARIPPTVNPTSPSATTRVTRSRAGEHRRGFVLGPGRHRAQYTGKLDEETT